MRPGRLDRKIEIGLPNEAARVDILKIHGGPITKRGDIDYDSVVKLADGFNAADLRNVCTEAVRPPPHPHPHSPHTPRLLPPVCVTSPSLRDRV